LLSLTIWIGNSKPESQLTGTALAASLFGVAADLLRLRACAAAAGRCRAAAVRATGCCLLLPACPCLGDWSRAPAVRDGSVRPCRRRRSSATKAPPLEARLGFAGRWFREKTQSRVRLPSRLPWPLGAGVVWPAGENMGCWASLGLRAGQENE